MSFAVGSLVRARSREWVVLPDSTEELLLLRPLGGTDEERAGVLTALEHVEPTPAFGFEQSVSGQIGGSPAGRLPAATALPEHRLRTGPERLLPP